MPRWLAHARAWAVAHASGAHARFVEERKRRLLGALRGDVLEIGPGAGANLAYLDRAVRWTGVEPNPYMHDYLRREAARLGLAPERLDLRVGSAEQLPLPDASVDAVVSSLVLCSVRDQGAALAEVRRVLRPGGRFVFIEHVAAPRGSWRRRLQRLLRAPWGAVSGGCRPDAETWRSIEAAGFSRVELQRFEVPVPVVSPHVAGVATK